MGDFAELERGIGGPGIDDLLGVDEDFVGRGGSCHDGIDVLTAACGKREPVFLFDPSRCLSEEPEWAEQER